MQDVLQKSVERKVTRCAIYTRVSTDQQAEVEFNSCEAQEDRIRSFIASQDGFKPAKKYSDPGFTGANVSRPGLQRLIADVKAGLIDMVITYKIDRLTRSPRDFYQLIEIFEAHNVGFISVTERFDTSTPAGRLLRNIMLTFAQFERELASERIRDKCAQRAQRGLYNGGRPPYGYQKEGGKLVVDHRRARVVRFIFEKYAEIRCAHQVTLALRDSWHERTGLTDSFVWRVLNSPAAAGKVTYKGKVLPGVHEPIISEVLFNHVQALMAEEHQNTRKPGSSYHHLPYTGIIECRECRSNMSPSHTDKKNPTGDRRYFYYRCTSTNHKGWNACSTRQINASRMENIIHQNLIRLSRDPLHLKQMLFSLQNPLQQTPETGIEPRPILDGLTPEILQNQLQEHVKFCARKTGIEKALAVRQGIEKVFYSKDSITVRFRLSRPPDVKMDSVQSDSTAALRAAPPAPPSARKTERPDSLTESSPSLLVGMVQNVEQEQSAANHRPEHPQYITWLLGKLRADRRLQAAAHLIGDRCIDLLRMEGGADGPPNLPRV
ncbi:MAG: recombinase family protein [Elusimicrobia bacterium]|nr:recombinase family protein [Elusimicrobiota bacterium]